MHRSPSAALRAGFCFAQDDKREDLRRKRSATPKPSFSATSKRTEKPQLPKRVRNPFVTNFSAQFLLHFNIVEISCM